MIVRLSDLVKDWFEEKALSPFFNIYPGATGVPDLGNPDITWFDIKATRKPFGIIIDYGNPRMLIALDDKTGRETIYPADPEFFIKLEKAIGNFIK